MSSFCAAGYFLWRHGTHNTTSKDGHALESHIHADVYVLMLVEDRFGAKKFGLPGVCMYVCMYVCACACACACVCVCVCVGVGVGVGVCTCTCTCTCLCVCVRAREREKESFAGNFGASRQARFICHICILNTHMNIYVCIHIYIFIDLHQAASEILLLFYISYTHI